MKYFYRKKGLLIWNECNEKAYGRAQRMHGYETCQSLDGENPNDGN